MIYVKLNETLYPANIRGKISDKDWDSRESKEITMEGDFETINTLFSNDTVWSIVQDEENEEGEIVQNEYDNSEFCIRGDLTVHIDGTCTVKMGKSTDLEDAYEAIYGGM